MKTTAQNILKVNGNFKPNTLTIHISASSQTTRIRRDSQGNPILGENYLSVMKAVNRHFDANNIKATMI